MRALWFKTSVLVHDLHRHGARATAFSIQLFTETVVMSGFFLKKKPPSTQPIWQHVNRK